MFLGSETIPLIQEAARLFRVTEPVDDVEIEGFVTRLARRPDQGPGEITLEGLVDGALRRVGVELPEAAHSLAVQAHDLRQRVSCIGDLVKRGGASGWRDRDGSGCRRKITVSSHELLKIYPDIRDRCTYV